MPRKIGWLVRSLPAWFARQARDLPWRHTRDPYAIWVSEIMLQQTQVKTVIPYWVRWVKALPDVTSLADAPQAQILKLWEGLGYYSRALNLQRAAQIIMEQHDARFPERFDDVLALPGVGRYTAGAICSISFNQPTPVLDGNVIRVLTRLFGIDRDPREKTTNKMLWALAQTLVAKAACLPYERPPGMAFWLSGPCSLLNQSLMELGALVCLPKDPRCLGCPAHRRCAAFQEKRISERPRLARRAKPTFRRIVAFALEHHGRWLVRQRPKGEINGQLWEFPSIEVDGRAVSPARLFAAHFGWPAPRLVPVGVIRHSITRYRIALEPFHIRLPRKPHLALRGARWLTEGQIEAVAFASAHRKLWKRIRPRTSSRH